MRNARFSAFVGALVLVAATALPTAAEPTVLLPADATVHPFGDAAALTGPGVGWLAAPVTAIARTPAGAGYWLLGADGGVFAYGDATFAGSAAGTVPDAPAVAFAPTATGAGYRIATSSGRVLHFGDAAAVTDVATLALAHPIVGGAAHPGGTGLWLVAADGGVFALGGAGFHGSLGSVRLNQPVVGMAAAPDGGGYWLVAADGGVFAFGSARFHGSAVGLAPSGPVVGIAATPTGGGYWLASSGTCDPPGMGSSDQGTGIGPGDSHLSGVTVTRFTCVHRVLFTFRGDTGPALVHAGVAAPPFRNTAGFVVDVLGPATLAVTIGGSIVDLEADPPVVTYTGPFSHRPPDGPVREVRLVDDFEGQLLWVIGIDAERPFRIQVLDRPARLVVDVATTGPATAVPVTSFSTYLTANGAMQARPRQVRDRLTVETAIRTLLDGPTWQEYQEGFTSAVPDTTHLRSATVTGGVAAVDLSSAFTSGGGSLSMGLRLAQVTWAATEVPGVTGVRLRVEGRPLRVLGGEGLLVPDVLTRATTTPPG